MAIGNINKLNKSEFNGIICFIQLRMIAFSISGDQTTPH